MARTFLLLASILGFIGVALGAFGAHALAARVEAHLLEVFETAVRYHFFHTLAMIGVAWACDRWPQQPSFVWAGWLFLAGILIFSGSLYLMTFTGQRWLGAITPIGGVSFLAGWLCIAWGAWRSSS